ncbi:MAG: hypothetical protein JKY48_08165, partial [Flavobacteriales bacterium]|nr:hypothetical protein [Flavobacteriales bacterium]
APTGTTLTTIYDCNWGGDIVFSSPRINTRGTVYSGTSSLTKNGSTDDTSVGGNTFTGNAILNNSSGSYIRMASGTPDTYGANLDINNTGSRHITLAYNSAGNTIAGNLTANNLGTGTSYIYLSRYTASTLSVTGTTSLVNNGTGADCRIYLGTNGDVTLSDDLSITNSASGNLSYVYVANGTNSTVSITGNTTVSNSGAGTTKQIYLGNYGDVTFNGTLSINNSSSASASQVYGHYDNNSLNAYNGNIIITNTDASGDGVLFGNSEGNGTLAAGQTISIGGAGFSAGNLYLRNFTQIGATAQTLAPTGTAIMTIYNSSWGGDVTFSSPRITTRGTVYSGTTSLTKTSSGSDASAGGNTFNANATITNSGSNRFRMGDGTLDVFIGDLTLNATGSARIHMAYNSLLNLFNGNIILNSTGSSTGIYIGNANGSGTLAAGRTITIGGSGFSVGTLYIRNFTQTGATAQTLAAIASTTMTIYDSNWGGDVVFSSPRITTRGTLYSGTVSLTKNGSADDNSEGGNTFIGNTVLTNNGSGQLLMNNSSGDTFVANLEVNNFGSDHIYIANNTGGNTVGGNLTVTNTGTGTNYVILTNSSFSALAVTGTVTLLNNGTGNNQRIYLGNSGDVSIGSSLTMTNSVSGTHGYIYVANNSNSSISVAGILQ